MVGRVLNFRYEVLEKLGDGGRFEVFRARDRVLNKMVALKLLRDPSRLDEATIRRVMTGAQECINLNHPNIVKTYECGQDGANYYIISEYVKGASVRERVQRSAPYSPQVAVELAIGIAEALEYSHKSGFVHGDLRPENVLISAEGAVKLSDFGTGNGAAGRLESAEPVAVDYLPPELLKGGGATAESDLYSLGVILFELLTGVLPFNGENARARAEIKQIEEPRAVRALNSSIPRTLEGIIAKACSREGKLRYRNATEMLEDLRTVRNALKFGRPLDWSPLDTGAERRVPDTGETAFSPPRDWLSLALKLFAGLFVVIIVFFGTMYVLRLFDPPEVSVPMVTNMSREEAERTLEQQGLVVGRVFEERSETIAKGYVIRQDPDFRGPKVKKGRAVDLWVSEGRPLTEVPNVTDRTLTTAKRLLADKGLGYMIREEPSDVILKGNVIQQDPPAGEKAEKGSKVTLVVSTGPPRIEDDPSRAEHSVNVTVNLQDAPDNHLVRIVVEDVTGSHTVYEEPHARGETFVRPVRFIGMRALIIIFGGENGDQELSRREIRYDEKGNLIEGGGD
jgi:serine/threonine-protein kinase